MRARSGIAGASGESTAGIARTERSLCAKKNPRDPFLQGLSTPSSISGIVPELHRRGRPRDRQAGGGGVNQCRPRRVVRLNFRGHLLMPTLNGFGTRTQLNVAGRSVQMYSIPALEAAGYPEIARLPYSLKILLENVLRHEDSRFVKAPDVETLARWDVTSAAQKEISFAPARVLLQD